MKEREMYEKKIKDMLKDADLALLIQVYSYMISYMRRKNK